MAKRAQVEIEGRTVSLSNLDKVFYPAAGWTKAHVLDYYTRVAPALLPHLRDRPLTLKRYPDGVEGEFFYEKVAPRHRPKWVRTEPVWSEGRGEHIPYVVCDDLPTLAWLANIADLELHTFLHRVRHVPAVEPGERHHVGPPPTAVAFDLDPGPPADLVTCAKVGLRLKTLFERLGLESFPKTSGSKGLQVYVPLNRPGTSYEAEDGTKPFARTIAELLERQDPKLVTSNMRKDLRKGKVFVDWSQNDDHKTTVCVYSLRAKERPTVSTPLAWEEVEACAEAGDADLLRFEAEDVLRRVEEDGDLFAPVLKLRQSLPAL